MFNINDPVNLYVNGLKYRGIITAIHRDDEYTVTLPSGRKFRSWGLWIKPRRIRKGVNDG